MARSSLRSRKQQVVRDAIFEAALELFATNGFDETTVEEVAGAAGISRATFFRYFASKDDLLAYNVMKYGAALTEAIKTSSPSFTPFEIVRKTVLAVAKESVNTPRTKQAVDISLRSPSAMQAHTSRMMDVEKSIETAFAKRIGRSSKDKIETRLLATLTLSTMNIAVMSWYLGEFRDLNAAVEQVFSRLTRILGQATSKPSARKGRS